MKTISAIALRGILVLTAAFILFVGINVGFGGIQTLGWQGQTSFFAVTDSRVFLIQDSHTRFFGGLFLGLGLFLLFALTNLPKYRLTLQIIFALIFLGGLARLTMLRPDVIFGPSIIGSLLAEIVLMPLLFFWVAKVAEPAKPTSSYNV